MTRLIVQSLETGRFLCPSLEDGQPVWETSLIKAGGGVVRDRERAMQLAVDYAEIGEPIQIIDLDRLGTANDYDIS